MGNYYLMTSYTSTIITLNVMSYTWKNVNPKAGDPYGLTANVCRPSVLTRDVGFALETNDPWYGNVRISAYNSKPYVPKGTTQPEYRRDEDPVWDVLDPGDIEYIEGRMVVDEGNVTRLASERELQELGYSRCETPECESELEILRQQQADQDIATETASLPSTEVTPTPASEYVAPRVESGAGVTATISQPTQVPAMGPHLRVHRRHYG